MNDQDRKEIARKLQECAVMYGKLDLTVGHFTAIINVYESVFNNTKDEIIRALDLYMRDSKNKFYPAPAHIREYLERKIDSKLNATDLARKIDKLILTRGSTWCDGYYYSHEQNYYRGKDNKTYWTFKEALISEIDELGFRIVESRGGWKNICHSAFENQESSFIAQLRDQCEYEIKYKLYANEESKYELLGSNNYKVIE